MSDQEQIRNSFGTVLTKLHQIIETLAKFEDHEQEKLNFSKLAEALELPPNIIEKIIELVLQFQYLYECLEGYELNIKEQGAIKYFVLTTKRAPKTREASALVPEKVKICREEACILNDVVYSFKQVRRGVGFDLTSKDANKKICQLFSNHPYLFFKNGNDLYYPSEFALELGQKLLSYKKVNQNLTILKIRDTEVQIS